MASEAMTFQLQRYRTLVSQFRSSLQAFQNSDSRFRVLKTVHSSEPYSPRDPSTPDPELCPKTLLILDSSFNPPSIAHRNIALAALSKASSDSNPGSSRLLLLFATMNADKAPSAASFDQRLTLMTIFAGDLLASLPRSGPDAHEPVAIDIGVTTVPYYTDKSAAIEEEGQDVYPSNPRHIHLIGFDTVTRFFNPKYYKDFSPPLSALSPYFDRGGHRLRVTLRPSEEYGTVDEQQAFVDGLASGNLEEQGGKTQWAEMIEVVAPDPKDDVSSTRIRKAAKKQDWMELEALCTENVTEWVRDQALYEADDQGAKMA